MARDDLHFRLRIPDDLKTRIEEAAAAKRRSMTAEIVARLEEYEALNLRGETLTSFAERKESQIEELQKSRVPQLPRGLFYRVDAAATQRKRSVQEEVIQALEAAFPAPVINEMDEVGYEWWNRITEAPASQRAAVLADANADLKARGWTHEFWLEPDDEHGTPTLVLGIRRFGPRKTDQ